MGQMHITALSTTAHEVVRLVVTGDLDIATIGQLQTELDVVLTGCSGPVEVDLSAVTFFSCAAAQTLRDAQLRSNESLTVIGAGPPIRRLLEIMHLESLLDAAVPA